MGAGKRAASIKRQSLFLMPCRRAPIGRESRQFIFGIWVRRVHSRYSHKADLFVATRRTELILATAFGLRPICFEVGDQRPGSLGIQRLAYRIALIVMARSGKGKQFGLQVR